MLNFRLQSWFAGLPWPIRWSLIGGGSIVSAFSSRLPETWQDVGLYCGLAALAYGVLATAWHHCIKWHVCRKAQRGSGLESWYFIIPCCFVAAVAIAAGAYGLGLRGGTSQAENPSANVAQTSDSRATFAKNEIIASINSNQAMPDGTLVMYTAELTSMGTRLRVFVDYSFHVSGMGFVGYSVKNRVEITEFKDYVRGQRIVVPVISRYGDGQSNLMRWGANAASLPDSQHQFALPDTIRARLVLMGADGKEQHHYFLITRGSSPAHNDVFPFVVGDETLAYRNEWEKEDAN